MAEPKKGETSASLVAVFVWIGEVYQLGLLRVYRQPILGKPKRQHLHYPVGVFFLFAPDNAD
jgi:hypothetical protein